jgi:hypothetical protein
VLGLGRLTLNGIWSSLAFVSDVEAEVEAEAELPEAVAFLWKQKRKRLLYAGSGSAGSKNGIGSTLGRSGSRSTKNSSAFASLASVVKQLITTRRWNNKVVTKPQARSNCDITSFRSDMGTDGRTNRWTNQRTN